MAQKRKTNDLRTKILNMLGNAKYNISLKLSETNLNIIIFAITTFILRIYLFNFTSIQVFKNSRNPLNICIIRNFP